MARKIHVAALAVLLACAPGAFAYEYEVRQTVGPRPDDADQVTSQPTGTLMYAKELFGDGSANTSIGYCRTVGSGCPSGIMRITLWTTLTDGYPASGGLPAGGDENEIDHGDEMTIVLTLRGAVFASRYRASYVSTQSYGTNNLMTLSGTSPINYRDMNVTVERGGMRGDSSVEFTVTALPTDFGWPKGDGGSSGTVLEVGFELPELMGLNGNTPVTAQIQVHGGGGSGFRSSNDPTVTIASGTARSESGVLRVAGPPNEDGLRPSTPLVNFADALTFMNNTVAWPFPPSTARINLAAGRTGFQPHATLPYAFLARPVIGVPTATISKWDGETFSIANREDGAGDLVVGVTGEFRPGDLVFLDLNGNFRPDNDERLTLRDGIMSGRFGLIEIAGIPTDSDMRMQTEGVAGRWLMFLPNGTDALRPADYRTTLSVDFTDATNRDKDGGNSISGDVATSYTTIDPDATRRAYAIPPVGATDLGNIRVKCETATSCPLYLECDDAGGDSWFQKLEDDVPGRATLRLNSAAIAGHLGISETGWEGRLSCNVMSTQDISVQVLTRSGDVLVNNTYIDG